MRFPGGHLEVLELSPDMESALVVAVPHFLAANRIPCAEEALVADRARQAGCCSRRGCATFFRTQVRDQDAVVRSALNPPTSARIIEAALEVFAALTQAYGPPMPETLDGSSLSLGLAHSSDKVTNNMERNAFDGDAIHSPCLSFQFARFVLPTFGPPEWTRQISASGADALRYRSHSAVTGAL